MNEALTHATIWMDLKYMMLSERSKSRKARLCDSVCMEYPEQANLWRQ